jgi:hypothetical protein
MYSVQKKDFTGHWIEVYRAQKAADADRFWKAMDGGSAKSEARVVQI